jgi:glutamate/aspartate transport system substrate-binding protein
MKKPYFAAAAVACVLWLCTGLASAQTDTLKKIKASRTITVGVRDASGAMSFTLGRGKYAGFHVEICERVIADIKKSLQLDKLDINYQLVTPQNRIPWVQNGTVHIECGTTTNSVARQKDVAFGSTLYVEGVSHRGRGGFGHQLAGAVFR